MGTGGLFPNRKKGCSLFPRRILGATKVMEYKGMQYSVVQTSSPTGWKWIVRLDGKTKTGTAPHRTAAVRFAEIAIEKAIRVKRIPKHKGQ